MFRKEIVKQNLNNYGVYKLDADNSVFNCIKIPEILYVGKNYFLIYGSDELKQNSEVLVEILDSQSNAVYYEVSDTYNFGGYRLVSIQIADNNANGVATLTILGISDNVPSEWKNKYNVKFQRKFIIDKTLNNINDIIFKSEPSASIQEIFKYDVQHSNVNSYTDYNTGKVSTKSQNVKQSNINYTLCSIETGSFSSTMLNSNIDLYISGSVTHSAKIINILNDKLSYIEPPYSVNGYITDSSHINYNIKYISSSLNTSIYSSSFAEINLTNLDTLSGKIEKLKVYYKNVNNAEDFNLLGDYSINSWNEFYQWEGSLLCDTGILKQYFNSTYYETGSAAGYTITTNDSILLNSLNVEKIPSETINTFYFQNKLPINLLKNNIYVLQFDSAVIPNADSQYEYCNLQIYGSGSCLHTETLLDEFNIKTNNYSDSPVYNNTTSIIFSPNISGELFIKFAFGAGDWYVSNLKLYNYFDIGNNPSLGKLYVPINNIKRDEQYEFKLEFVNINNNTANKNIIIDLPVKFVGNPTYISMEDNYIDGAIKIKDEEDVERVYVGLLNTTGSNVFNEDYGKLALLSSSIYADDMSDISGWSTQSSAIPGYFPVIIRSAVITSGSAHISSSKIEVAYYTDTPANGIIYNNVSNTNFNDVEPGNYILAFGTDYFTEPSFNLTIKDSSNNILVSTRTYLANQHFKTYYIPFNVQNITDINILFNMFFNNDGDAIYLYDMRLYKYYSRVTLSERGLLMSISDEKYLLLGDDFNMIGLNDVQTVKLETNEFYYKLNNELSLEYDNSIGNYLNVTGSIINDNNELIKTIYPIKFDTWLSTLPYGKAGNLPATNVQIVNMKNCSLISSNSTGNLEASDIFSISNVSQSSPLSSSIYNNFSFALYSSLPVDGNLMMEKNSKIYCVPCVIA